MMKKRFLATATTALLCLVTVFSVTACEGYSMTQIDQMINKLQTELDANEVDFNDKIADLIAQYEAEDGELQAQIDANETAIANLKTEYDAKLADLQTQITANKTAIENTTGGYIGSLEGYVTDEELQDLKDEYDDKIANLQTQITATLNEIDRVETEYKNALEGYLKTDDFNAYKAETLVTITNLQTQINEKQTAIDELDQKYTDELEKYVLKTDYEAYKTEVANKIDALQDEIDANETAIADLDAKYIAELEKYANKTALEALQTKHAEDIEFIKNAIENNAGEGGESSPTELSNAIAIQELRSSYEAKVLELASADTANSDKIAQLTTTHNNDKAELQAQITANLNAINEHKSAYNDKLIELANKDSENADKITELTNKHNDDKNALQTQITANLNAINEHKSAYNDKLVELANKDSENATAIANLKADYEDKIEELEGKIDSNLDKINEVDGKYAQDLITLGNRVSANETAIANLKADYDAKIAQLQAKDTELQNAISELDGGYVGNTGSLQSQIDILAQAQVNLRNKHDSEIATLTEKHNEEIAELNTLINEIKAVDQTQNDKILELENKVNALINGIDRVVTFNYADGRENDEVTVKNGQKVTQPTNPTRTGYTFEGWYGGLYGDEKWVFIGYTVTEDITLTAKWTPNTYTVTFNSGVDGQTVESQTATFDGEFNLPTAPSKVGHTFQGWYNGNDEIENGANWTLTENVELTAKWSANTYTVSYDANGGEGEYEDEQAVYGANYDLATAPSKTDYEFVGWFNGDEEFNDGDYLVDGDITLTAKWKLVFNNITFNGNTADSGEVASMKIGVNDTKTINANGYAKAGYLFAGWSTSADGVVTYHDGDVWTANDVQNNVLYARWVSEEIVGTINSNATLKTYLDDSETQTQFDFASAIDGAIYDNESAYPIGGTFAYNSVPVENYSIENGTYKVEESEFKAGNGKQLSGKTNVSVNVIVYENGIPVGVKTAYANMIIVTKVLRTSADIDGWYELAQQDWVCETALDTANNVYKTVKYGGYFELGNNIHYTGTYKSVYGWFNGCSAYWTNVGGFQGTFDGCGYVIDGMDFSGTMQGFFGGVVGKNGVIKNIGFTNVVHGTNGELNRNVLGQNLFGGTVENVFIHLKKMYNGASPNGSSAFFFANSYGAKTNNLVLMVDSLGYTYGNASVDTVFTNALGFVQTSAGASATITNAIAITAGEDTYYDRTLATPAPVKSSGTVYGYNTYADAVNGKTAYANTIKSLTDTKIFKENKDGFPVSSQLLYPSSLTLKNSETAVGDSLELSFSDEFYNYLPTTWTTSANGVSVNGNTIVIGEECLGGEITVTATNHYGSTKSFTVNVSQSNIVNGLDQELNDIDETSEIRFSANGEIVNITLGGKALSSYDYEVGRGVTIPSSAYPTEFGNYEFKVLTYDNDEYTLTKLNLDYATMVISNKAELIKFSNLERSSSWGLGELYVLNADIDMQGEDYSINVNTDGGNQNMTDKGFRGTFDGRGHVISNINVTGNGFISGVQKDGMLKNVSFINATQTSKGFIGNGAQGGGIQNLYIQVTPSSTAQGALGTFNFAGAVIKNVVVDVPSKSGNYYVYLQYYNKNYGTMFDVYGIGLNNEHADQVSPSDPANTSGTADNTFVFNDYDHFTKPTYDINGNAISYADMDNDFWDIVNGVPVPAHCKDYPPAILNTGSTEVECGDTITIKTNAVPYGRLSIYDGTQGVSIAGNTVTVTDKAQGQTFTVQYVATVTGLKAVRTYTVKSLTPSESASEYTSVSNILDSAELTNGDFYVHNQGLSLPGGNKQHSFNYYGVGGQSSALTSINSQPDDIMLTNGGVAIQKDVFATEYYLEGILDSTTTAYKFQDGIAGLLIATGPKWVLSGTTVESMRLQAGVLGNDIITCASFGWGSNSYGTFQGSESIKVCDWTERFTANELASMDKTALKFGVLRFGSNKFAFFINDRYITYRSYGDVDVASSGFSTFGESAIGVVASYTKGGALYDGGTSVLDFKCTTDRATLDALRLKVPAGKSIDLYLIAGQSNAAGNAVFNADTIRSKDKTLITGNPDVLISATHGNYVLSNMKAGYGEGSNKIGAEAGITNYVTSITSGSGGDLKFLYDADEGRYACVVKTAVGGTGFDYAHSTTDQQNWLRDAGWWGSPSWISANGYTTAPVTVRNLYNELVNNVVNTVTTLKADGFENITIKGLFWMQGERHVGAWGQSDMENVNNTYYKAFNAFITDLRGELNTKLGSTIGQDLTQMKVLIGQIAETFGTKDMDTTAYNNKVAQNQNFIKVQKFIANNIYGIETFDTQAYPLNRLIGGKNHVFGSQYSDHYHWGEDAMFAIGRGVGEKLYNSDLLK